VEIQGEIAKERKGRGQFYNWLVAMVFASYTVEAYLNFVGELVAPQIWKDERNYFRKEPYRGFEGKLRRVMELVSLPYARDARPLKTVLELKELRDLIAHPKTEPLDGCVRVPGQEPPILPAVTTLSKMVTADACAAAIQDVEGFLDSVHTAAQPNVDDVWFGARALRGPAVYVGSTSRFTRD
jgi:hypothetical protein